MNTTINPWEMTATGEPVADNLRLFGSNSAAINASGEFNAQDTRSVLQQITKLMQMASSGQIKKNRSTPEQKAERRMLMASAYHDTTGKQWAMLGANIADSLRAQAEREGFMRRIMQGTTLNQGEIPRVSLYNNETVAVVATSSSNIEYQMVRGNVFFPSEFHLINNLMVEDVEIQQVSGDTLERAYNQGVESIMVGEDRMWKKMADMTANVDNSILYIGSQLSPSTLAQVRSGVTGWNLPCTTIVLASNLWEDIIGNDSFHTLFNEIHRYDLVLNGQIGTMLGMEVITDAFRDPNQKVLNKGEMYAVASPEYHGAYTDRGGVVSTPIDGAQTGTTNKGWFLKEMLSMVIANPRSVMIGKRTY